MTTPPLRSSASTVTRRPLTDLRARFRSAAGMPLTAEAALTYDAVMLLATSARATRAERDAIKDYLTGLGTERPPYDGATGPISFDENGDSRPSYFLVEITGEGSRVVLGSSHE